MTRLKPLNKKAARYLEARADGTAEEVVAMQSVAGCTTSLDPGWEVERGGKDSRQCSAHDRNLQALQAGGDGRRQQQGMGPVRQFL